MLASKPLLDVLRRPAAPPAKDPTSRMNADEWAEHKRRDAAFEESLKNPSAADPNTLTRQQFAAAELRAFARRLPSLCRQVQLASRVSPAGPYPPDRWLSEANELQIEMDRLVRHGGRIGYFLPTRGVGSPKRFKRACNRLRRLALRAAAKIEAGDFRPSPGTWTPRPAGT